MKALPVKTLKIDGGNIFVSNQKDTSDLTMWAYVENQREVNTMLWDNHPESDFYGKGEKNYKASLYNFKDGIYVAPNNLCFELTFEDSGNVSAKVIGVKI